ncbi:MFS transporter [Paraburkholderia lacunae]|uniref:Arabinose ABC transporter permease n=1 Tax=Paraburkholderia lacunae TaxID=2211104 RepID=A0A370MWN0_9BURK|nr:MFS transporter [Paraburkholderia lacunae]RDJ97803.1 arabinose ABC transporter permease [Paraburkholderia lacunae]
MSPSSPGRLFYATIFLLVSIDFLQSGMTAFAAGPLMGELGMAPEDFSFATAVYASVAILSISMQRWFVERLGPRRFVQYTTAICAGGAVLCAISDDFSSFLAGRAVMALGGGALFTSARMMIHHALVGPARFVGIKYLVGGLALNTAAAPWLASLAVSHERWSAIYWLLAALGGLVVFLASMVLHNRPLVAQEHRSEPDLWPQIILVGGSFLMLYALQRFYYDFYGNVLLIGMVMALAVVGLMFYGHTQHVGDNPILRVRDMLNVRYVSGVALFMFIYTMLGANNYMIPMTLQRTLGFGWATVGDFEALGFAGGTLAWWVVMRTLPRHPSPRKFLVIGFFALAVFGALLSRIDGQADMWRDILPALAIYSVFLPIVMPVAAMNTFRELEYDESVFANAQQMKNMLAQIGIALGITLATLGQQWRTTAHYAVLNERVASNDPIYVEIFQKLQESLTNVTGAVPAAQMATAEVAQLLARESALLAHIDYFGLVAVLGLAGVLVTLIQRVFR